MGGATHSYKRYSYVPPIGNGFLRLFGINAGVYFAHFGLESGMVFDSL